MEDSANNVIKAHDGDLGNIAAARGLAFDGSTIYNSFVGDGVGLGIATWDGSSWSSTIVDPDGKTSDIRLDGNNNPELWSIDRPNDDVQRHVNDGTGWTQTTIEASEDHASVQVVRDAPDDKHVAVTVEGTGGSPNDSFNHPMWSIDGSQV
jgi:hypothetical protein